MTVWWSNRALIRSLQDQISYLREQVEHERQRAELAVDRLLETRLQILPITQPTPSEARKMHGDMSDQIRDLETEMGQASL